MANAIVRAAHDRDSKQSKAQDGHDDPLLQVLRSKAHMIATTCPPGCLKGSGSTQPEHCVLHHTNTTSGSKHMHTNKSKSPYRRNATKSHD